MIATRILWRYSQDSYPYQTRCSDSACALCGGRGFYAVVSRLGRSHAPHFINDSELKTFHAGDRVDWVKGGVYEQLGWAVAS